MFFAVFVAGRLLFSYNSGVVVEATMDQSETTQIVASARRAKNKKRELFVLI